MRCRARRSACCHRLCCADVARVNLARMVSSLLCRKSSLLCRKSTTPRATSRAGVDATVKSATVWADARNLELGETVKRSVYVFLVVALAAFSANRLQATPGSAAGSRVYRSMTESPLLGKKVVDGQVLPCSDSQSTWFLTFRFESGEPECYVLSREVLTTLLEQALAAGAFRSPTGAEGRETNASSDTQTGRRKTDQ